MTALNYLLLAIGLAAAGLLAYRFAQIWTDAGRRGFEPGRRLLRAASGALVPALYWWGARIQALSPEEAAALLDRETAALGLGLSRADSLRCPLCETEIPGAWTLTPAGAPTVAPGPVECPRCDFRLDACRHCAHFLPGRPTGQHSGSIQFGTIGNDLTSGRCKQYRTSQPVEQACPPEVARQLKSHGWDRVRSPRPIVDSFLPPDFCTAFQLHRKRLRLGGVRWPDARRVALLRILDRLSTPAEEAPEDVPPSEEEQWLL